MTTQQQIEEAYERVRLAELGKRGADAYAEDAGRILEESKASLESLLKGIPNRGAQ